MSTKLSPNTRWVFDYLFERLEGASFDAIGDSIDAFATRKRGTERLATAQKPTSGRVHEFLSRHEPLFEGRTISIDDRWCGRCQTWKHKSQFTEDKSRIAGVARYCRKCQSQYMKDRRAEKKRRWNDGKHLAAAVIRKRK